MTYKFPEKEGRIDCHLRSCCFTCMHANIETGTEILYCDGNITQRVVRIQCEHECVCEKYCNAEDRETVSEIMWERVPEDE